MPEKLDPEEGNKDLYDETLVQRRAWLIRHDLPPNIKFPAEREPCEIPDVSRGDLRKALATVGRGGPPLNPGEARR